MYKRQFKDKAITQTNTADHRQFLLCADTDFATVKTFLLEPQAREAQTIVVVQSGSLLTLASSLEQAGIKCATNSISTNPTHVSLLSSADMVAAIRGQNHAQRCSIIVYKGFSAHLVEPLALLNNTHFIFEDFPQFSLPASLKQASVDVMPATSFSYMSRLNLARKSA